MTERVVIVSASGGATYQVQFCTKKNDVFYLVDKRDISNVRNVGLAMMSWLWKGKTNG